MTRVKNPPDRLWLCKRLFMGSIMEVTREFDRDVVAEYVRRDVVRDMIRDAVIADREARNK